MEIQTDIRLKTKNYKLCHNSILKNVLEIRDISITKLAKELNTLSLPTILKFQHTPEKFSIEQIKEIAGLMGIGAEALMVELGMIGAPTSYDLVKGEYVYD